MGPREIDALEIWEAASVLGRNEIPVREPWQADWPDMRMVRRSLCRDEERDYDRDAPIDDDEYARLVALAKSGTRTAAVSA